MGFIFFDTVYVGAVFNYAAQSEMNIYLLRAIRRLIYQKSHEEMDGAIKVCSLRMQDWVIDLERYLALFLNC